MPFPFRPLAAPAAVFAALVVLLGAATGAFALSPENALPESSAVGNWVTTGRTVAATTFTQAQPGGVPLLPLADISEETAAQTSVHFLRLSPRDGYSEGTHLPNGGTPLGTFDGYSQENRYVSSTLGTESVAFGDLSGGAAAVVPEPGPMVTVVVLGFMTGVALLRGQSRTGFGSPVSR